MCGMTKDQLRFANSNGVVAKTCLQSCGDGFQIVVHTSIGNTIPIVSSRAKEARTFTNPANALAFLRSVGITAGEFNTEDWTPKAQARQVTAQHLTNDALESILEQAARADTATTTPLAPRSVMVDVAGVMAGLR